MNKNFMNKVFLILCALATPLSAGPMMMEEKTCLTTSQKKSMAYLEDVLTTFQKNGEVNPEKKSFSFKKSYRKSTKIHMEDHYFYHSSKKRDDDKLYNYIIKDKNNKNFSITLNKKLNDADCIKFSKFHEVPLPELYALSLKVEFPFDALKEETQKDIHDFFQDDTYQEISKFTLENTENIANFFEENKENRKDYFEKSPILALIKNENNLVINFFNRSFVRKAWETNPSNPFTQIKDWQEKVDNLDKKLMKILSLVIDQINDFVLHPIENIEDFGNNIDIMEKINIKNPEELCDIFFPKKTSYNLTGFSFGEKINLDKFNHFLGEMCKNHFSFREEKQYMLRYIENFSQNLFDKLKNKENKFSFNLYEIFYAIKSFNKKINVKMFYSKESYEADLAYHDSKFNDEDIQKRIQERKIIWGKIEMSDTESNYSFEGDNCSVHTLKSDTELMKKIDKNASKHLRKILYFAENFLQNSLSEKIRNCVENILQEGSSIEIKNKTFLKVSQISKLFF